MASGRAKELSHWCTVSPARTSKSEAAGETERRIESNTPQSRQSILNSWPRACSRGADAAERCKRSAASATFQRAAARPQHSHRTPATVPGLGRPPSKCLLDSEYSLKRRNRTFCLWVQPDVKSSQVKSIKVRLFGGCWFCDACVCTCVQTAPDSVSAFKVHQLHQWFEGDPNARYSQR